MKIVYAAAPRVIAFGGMRVALRPGEPWDGDDPLVKQYPDAFVTGPTKVRSTRDPSGLVDVPAQPAPKRPGRPPKAAQ